MPQLTNTRSETGAGWARNRLMNATTGSNNASAAEAGCSGDRTLAMTLRASNAIVRLVAPTREAILAAARNGRVRGPAPQIECWDGWAAESAAWG